MIKLLMKICRFSFGTFEEQEFLKFVRIGIVFFLLIGTYWTLRPLKDSIFMQLVGKTYIPYAKTISLILMIPTLAIYAKIIQKIKKDKVFNLLVSFYIIIITIFILPVFLSQVHLVTNKVILNIIGYSWYFLVESFGSIMLTFFWALLTDTTNPQSAKKGFAFVYLFGQIGGTILPCSITKIPLILGMKTDIISLIILAFLIYLIIPISKIFFEATPKDLLTSFTCNRTNNKVEFKNENTKFIDGIKLLCSHKYLILLFLMELSFEFIMTIIDFNFKVLAGTAYSGVELTGYLGKMASSANMISALVLIFLSSRIQRLFGLRIAISFIPIIVGSAFLFFVNTNPSLQMMFILVVIGKAVNYAFRPSFKQLYIPTSPIIHFKLQAWNDVFGSRSAKQMGSMFNILFRIIGKAKYLMLGKIIGLPLVITWIISAIYLGKTCDKAIDEKRIII